MLQQLTATKLLISRLILRLAPRANPAPSTAKPTYNVSDIQIKQIHDCEVLEAHHRELT